MADTTVDVKGGGLDGAIDSAFDESLDETKGQETSPGVDAAPVGEATPVAQETDPAAHAVEPEESFRLSPEELAAVKADPTLGKLYKSLLRGSTQKYQEIAADRKFLEAVREDPRGVIEMAAQQLGLQLVDPQTQQAATQQQAMVDTVMPRLEGLFGKEAAAALRPVFNDMISQAIKQEIQPLAAETQEFRAHQINEQASSIANSFREKFDVTPDVEEQMMELTMSVQPSPNATPEQFLEFLHTVVTAKQAPAAAAKEMAKRVQKARNSAEPVRGAAPSKPASENRVKPGMSLDDAFNAAWKQAQEELGVKQ